MCIALRTAQRQRRGFHWGNVFVADKNHHIFSVRKQFHSHFIDVEHEGWVETIHVDGEVVLERLDLILSPHQSEPVSRGGKLVAEAVFPHEPPQRLSGGCDVELVYHKLHGVVQRDGLVGIVSRIDEVFYSRKNLTKFAWTTHFRFSSPGWRRWYFFYPRHDVVGQVYKRADVRLGDSVDFPLVEKAHDLHVALSLPPEVALADFHDERKGVPSSMLGEKVEPAVHKFFGASRQAFIQIVLVSGVRHSNNQLKSYA